MMLLTIRAHTTKHDAVQESLIDNVWGIHKTFEINNKNIKEETWDVYRNGDYVNTFDSLALVTTFIVNKYNASTSQRSHKSH